MKQLKVFTAARGAWKVLGPAAHEHRRRPTPAEDILWQRLRRGGLGVKFRRQHVIDRYIADFFCFAAGLVIEVDGPIHDAQQEQDKHRDAVLIALGYEVARYTNDQVVSSLEEVLADILRRVEKRTHRSP